MMKMLRRTGEFVVEGIRNFDRYPRMIAFTYKRKNEFKTLIGGVISICTYVTLALYAYLLVRIMFEKNNTSKNISLTVNDITVDTNPIYLNSTNFMFGIGVFSEYKYISDETYVSMSIIQHNFIGSADSPTTYKLEAWSNNKFPSISNATLNINEITNYYWPKSTNFTVLGNYFSDNKSFFEFRITRWSGTDAYGNACKSDADIDKVLDSTYVQIAMLKNYFDFEDYNQPIKSYLDDSIYYFLMSGFSKRVDLYVRQNSVENVDSIFRYQPGGSEDSFISIEPVLDQLNKVETEFAFVMNFYKDAKSISYQRTVFSMLDWTGLIGGANEILKIIGKLIVGLFSGRIFLFTVISSLYQVDISSTKERINKWKVSNEKHFSENRRTRINTNNIDNDIRESEKEELSKRESPRNRHRASNSDVDFPIRLVSYSSQIPFD